MILGSFTVSGKKYALNKVYASFQVRGIKWYSYQVVSLVLTGYEFALPCVHFVYLAFLDHSTPDYL